METDCFVESVWVGQGKSYDVAKIPACVSEAKGKLLAIPEAFETRLLLSLTLKGSATVVISLLDSTIPNSTHYKLL